MSEVPASVEIAEGNTESWRRANARDSERIGEASVDVRGAPVDSDQVDPARTLLVDGTNLLVRAAKAMERTSLSAHGVETATLHVFLQILAKFVRASNPSKVMVCWDAGHDRRTEIYPRYKANRIGPRSWEDTDPMSPFALAKKFCDLAGVPQASVTGFEADDVIAHYWRKRGDDHLVIVSGDRDFFQLLELGVEQWRPIGNGEIDVWDHDRVVTEIECAPRHYQLAKALAGDSSDGIDGLPRVGIKTAVKMLRKNGWNVDRACAEMRFDIVRRNLLLMDLRTELWKVECPDISSFTPTVFPNSDLQEFLEHYELRSIIETWGSGMLWADTSADHAPDWG